MAGLSGESIQPLLTWRPGDVGPRPGFGGTGEDIRYMQGTVVQWNPDTAENIVRIRGVDHNNVPLIDLGVGQRVMQPGDQVAIMAWSPNGGTAAYFIMGRLVVPGTTAAQRSEQALESLVAQLTMAIFGSGINQHVSHSQASYTSSTGGYTDHSQGNPATLPDIEVGDTGRCWVIVAAIISSTATNSWQGSVTVEISGASSETPSLGSPALSHSTDGSGWIEASRSLIFEDLNPGLHDFETKYWAEPGNAAVRFDDTALVVIPF